MSCTNEEISVLNFELEKHMKDDKIYLYSSCYAYNTEIKIDRADSKLDGVDYVDVFIYKGNKITTFKDGKIKRNIKKFFNE
jgi:hypothetical protein